MIHKLSKFLYHFVPNLINSICWGNLDDELMNECCILTLNIKLGRREGGIPAPFI
jgi:hypothetical protein